jgi:hypothetical protein
MDHVYVELSLAIDGGSELSSPNDTPCDAGLLGLKARASRAQGNALDLTLSGEMAGCRPALNVRQTLNAGLQPAVVEQTELLSC